MKSGYKYRALMYLNSDGSLGLALVKSWRHLNHDELSEWLGGFEVVSGKLLSKQQFYELQEMFSFFPVVFHS
ncbi:MAG: hypothetical protein AAGG68_28755 [Bacteroidota bacterium]